MNPNEEVARCRKVLALLAFVPCGGSKVENAVVADWLAGLSTPERAVFAKMAKVRSPSTETWRELVAAVRARRSVDEVEGFAWVKDRP